jgi:hypothetical protein
MHQIEDRRFRSAPLALAGLLVLAGAGPSLADDFSVLSGSTPSIPAVAAPVAPMPAAACPPPQGYVPYRPVLSRLLEPKEFYLSNYAGVQYPSRAPGATLTPTTFRAITSARRRSFFWNR